VLHKEIPFLRIGLPLCVGIISGLYINPDTTLLLISAIIIVTCFIASLFFSKYEINKVYGIALTAALIMCGHILYKNEKNGLTTLKSEKTIFACTLSDFPEEKAKSYMITVKLNSIINRDNLLPVGGSMIIYCIKDTSLTSYLPGDQLIIRCTPQEIKNRGNPYEFDYRFYLENHGIRYTALINYCDIVRHKTPDTRKITHVALIIREKIIELYKKSGITGEKLAMVAAITLGQKNMLDSEQKQNFIKAGVMHIMAVSGLHAMILSLFVLNILFFLKRKFNFLRILITILILWSFAFVTGLTPSVLRATLMFTFLQAGNLINRRVNGINSVLASAFVLIMIEPSVIFNSGFLLSFSAVIYIISFYQDFYNKVHLNNWFTDKIWQSAVVTIVAQAGTLPLTIMLFNRFPAYFLFTNILIIPVASLLIVTGCLVPLLSPVPFLSHFFAGLLNYLTSFIGYLTTTISSLPSSSIENIGLTTPECILLTITLFTFSYYILKKKSVPLYLPMMFFLLLAFVGTITDISSRKTNELIVYNTPGSSVIGVKSGKVLTLYSDTSVVRPEVLRHSATLGLKINYIPLVNRYYCIRAGEKNILICKSPEQAILNSFNPDFMIITDPESDIRKSLVGNKSARAIVITSSISKILYYPKNLIDTIHLVKTSGAFRAQI